MKPLHPFVVLLLAITATLSTAVADDATQGKPTVRSLMFSVCYVREARDQPWNLRIEGKLPRGPGLYYIVRNEKGEAIHRGEIAWGDYPAEKPLIIKIKPDGIVGDYAIQLIGQQDNLTGLVLPLTTLPLEVYGDTGFALGYGTGKEARLVSFQVDKPTDVIFGGGRGNYRILHADGSVLVDSKLINVPMGDPKRYFGSYSVETHFRVEPGRVYWVDPYEVLYFGPKDPLYMTYDPKRWFSPKMQWRIEGSKWWKGLAQ